MSSSEIIAELPKLTHEERRAICRQILALEADQEALQSAHQAAVTGFQLLDQMEAEDEKPTHVAVMSGWSILASPAKVRPCLLLTDYPAPEELALITILPHTTALRGNKWEVNLPLRFLQPGAFSPSTNPIRTR